MASIAAVVGAVIVKVAVAEFAPGVTDAGEIAHVGIGDGPDDTAQESRMALAKLPF